MTTQRGKYADWISRPRATIPAPLSHPSLPVYKALSILMSTSYSATGVPTDQVRVQMKVPTGIPIVEALVLIGLSDGIPDSLMRVVSVYTAADTIDLILNYAFYPPDSFDAIYEEEPVLRIVKP
jgi:hypothetical protein